MAADFNTPTSITTPGSAVADTLQTILATKRANDRQTMLDQLNAQNVQSQIKDRDLNAQETQERIKSLSADRQAQEIGRRLGNFSKGQPLVGSDLNYVQQNAPSMVIPGQEGTQPLQPGDQGPEMPTTPSTFYGTPKEVDADKHTQLQKALMSRMGDPTSGWDSAPDAQKEIEFFNATGRSIPESVLRPKVGGKIYAFDDATGSLTDPVTHQKVTVNGLGPNDRIEHIPAKQPRAEHYTDLGPETDEAGKPTGNRIQLDRDTGKYNVVPAIRIGPKTPPKDTATKGSGLYDPVAYNGFISAMKNPNATAEVRNRTMQNLINTVKDPQVKADVVAIIGNPQAHNMPVEALISSGVLSGQADHIEKVKEVLAALRGQ